jgi:hypothetical protein
VTSQKLAPPVRPRLSKTPVVGMLVALDIAMLTVVATPATISAGDPNRGCSS